MGFPYGDARYGKGLYSRRPDEWRDKICQPREWATAACIAPVWTSGGPVVQPVWRPENQQLPRQRGPLTYGR